MELQDPKLEKAKNEIEGDSSADRSLSASTTEASTREDRETLLSLARSGFVRSDTTTGADGKIDIPPIFPTFTTAASVLESKQKNDLRSAKPGDAAAPPAPADGDLGGGRSRLTEIADRLMAPHDLRDLTEHMKAFELRAKERGLPEKEVASTYHHVSRLLEATGETPLTTDQRHRLALQVMENAADPTMVSQGNNRTCSVAAVESAVYTRNPSDAARLVVEIATTGRYRTRTGDEVEVDPTPRTEAARYEGIRKDGTRVHASEIFQITAVNALHQSRGATLRYDQVPPTKPSDSGERLFSTDIPGPVRESPGLKDRDIVATARLITGHDRIGMIHSEEYAQPDPLVDKATSVQELNSLLLRAKQEDRLPLIVAVNANLEPMSSYGADFHPTDLSISGSHAVTITDYHPGPPPTVNLDNQWEKIDDFLGDKRLSVEDLWKLMQYPHTAQKVAQQQVDQLRAVGRFDPVREAELLRLQVSARSYLDSFSPPEESGAAVPPDENIGERLRLRLGSLNQEQLEAAFDRVWEQFTAHCSRTGSCSADERKVLTALAVGPITAHENTLSRLRLLNDRSLVPAAAVDGALPILLSRWSSSGRPESATALKDVRDFIATLPEARRRAIEIDFRILRSASPS